MSFISSLLGWISGTKTQKEPKKFRKKGKLSKCNLLRFYEGIYASDSGLSDYKSYYIVINGTVKKKILKKHRKHEDTDMFDYIQLTPLTKTAYVRVVHEDIPLGSPGRHGKTVRSILLTKSRFRRTIIRLNR